MQIVFYKNSSDNNAVPKVIDTVGTYTGSMRASTVSILSPVFEVSSAVPIDANYMHIPAFNRYYFCSVEIIRTGLYRITGNVDVLQTYFDSIKNCPCVVDRANSIYNAFIPDNNRQFYQYTKNQYITIGDIGLPSVLVLATVG